MRRPPASSPRRLFQSHLLAAALAMGCAPKPTPVETYTVGDRGASYEAQRQAVAQADPRDQPLEQLRLGSMALAMGRPDAAEAAWRAAVGRMTDFRADGEFRALVGAEDNKEWKGEPYEKMAAFVSLGALLHSKGDLDNALAMYKSAVLADTGSKEERYRSDFVVAFALQAIAYAAEREPGNATQAMERAIDARVSRFTVDTLTDALRQLKAKDLTAEDLDLARALLLAAMPGGVSASPRDPVEATRATVSWATDLLKQQQTLPKKERLPELAPFKDKHFGQAARALPLVAKRWTLAVAARPDASGEQGRALAAQLRRLLTNPPPVILVVEAGRGPAKIRTGDYGEVLTIVPSRSGGAPPAVTLDGGPPLTSVALDDLSYQATTRGGRAVDGFLKGKAVYKDASMISAFAFDVLSDIAYASGNDTLGVIGDVVSIVALVSSVATNPAADIRQWELAPNTWHIVGIDAPPGDHVVTIGSRRATLRVPARGQDLHLIPALPPGGPTTLGRTE